MEVWRCVWRCVCVEVLCFVVVQLNWTGLLSHFNRARPLLSTLPIKAVPQLHGKMGSKVKLALQESRFASSTNIRVGGGKGPEKAQTHTDAKTRTHSRSPFLPLHCGCAWRPGAHIGATNSRVQTMSLLR